MPYLHNDMDTIASAPVEDSLANDLAELKASALGKACEDARSDSKQHDQMAKVDENGGTASPPTRSLVPRR